MKFTFILLLTLFVNSCAQQTKSDSIVQTKKINENPIREKSKNSEKKTNYKLITNISKFNLNGKSWQEIELSGPPDTALTFFAYRILFTNNLEEMNDCVTRMNLIESSDKVKLLMPKIFAGHLNENKVNFWIDSLNQRAIEYAEKQVELDIKKYGGSDGPCFELYQMKK